MRRSRTTIALACAASVAVPTAAFGHGGPPAPKAAPPAVIKSALDSAPSVPGLRVRLVRGRVGVVNETGRDLTVLGSDGRPMLRVGPRGVRGNAASGDWLRSGPPGVVGTAQGPRLGGPPRYRRVSPGAAWSFFDDRVNPRAPFVPAAASRGEQPSRLADWTVPMLLGRRALKLRGHLEYEPQPGRLSRRLTSTDTPFPAVRVTVLTGPVPGLYVVNVGRAPVTVLGAAGEPFARIGPRAVEVNLRSPAYEFDQAARGRRSPLPPDAKAAPRWRRVTAGGTYSWIDSRVGYSARVPADIVRDHRAAVLRRWAIPMRAGARRVEVTGLTTWAPVGAKRESGLSTGGVLAIVAGVLLLLGLAAAALRVRRWAS